jgi:hypothetical protein
MIWEEYGFEQKELVEFALIDIKRSANHGHMIGLPYRLARWYQGELLELKPYRESYYRAAAKQYNGVLDAVLNLAADLKKVMKSLEGDFSLWNRFHIKKNRIKYAFLSKRMESQYRKKQREGWKGRTKDEIEREALERRMKLYSYLDS